MLSSENDPDKWRLLCMQHFQKPLGNNPDARSVNAVCVGFDKDIVEFKNVADDFHFDIPTELFYLIPNIDARVTIDRVHYRVRAVTNYSNKAIDLISGIVS